MYKAIIKGSRPDALKALEQRDIKGAQVLDYDQHHHETHATIPESSLTALIRWFCESDSFNEHGYAAGTLLFYR